jgi:hypothetical protein|tara:strand:+ start:508 stop:657 length:150 start_codon:yes stop_codon:yes gene_type:complete
MKEPKIKIINKKKLYFISENDLHAANNPQRHGNIRRNDPVGRFNLVSII